MATLVNKVLKSEDGPRVGIPVKALFLYSKLIVIEVVGCVQFKIYIWEPSNIEVKRSIAIKIT